jgi:peptidoglycan/LPS O-acetylase OafA/YrhL
MQSTPVEPSSPRWYFPHVEGLRGLAALYVFLYHVWQTGISHQGATLSVLLPLTLPWLQFGHFAVAVFIVISGYCLGLPVAQRLKAPFDVRRFAMRRARRLGPAYVLALFLSVIPFFVATALRGQHIPLWHVGVAMATHLALVHNWIPSLAEYLNGPMWSIALECQIYVIFALLLIPVWKRFGPWAQLAIAVLLGLLPHFALHGRLDYSISWLLGLFAMGVAAAHVTAKGGMVSRVWRWIAFGIGLVALAAVLPQGDAANDGSLWPADLLVGTAVSLLFVTSNEAALPWMARLLSLRPIVTLGTFSYSLYLVHGPLVVVTGAALARYHAGVAASAVAYALLIPSVIGLAYAFYRVAERPFLSAAFRSAIEPSRDAADVPRNVAVVYS